MPVSDLKIKGLRRRRPPCLRRFGQNRVNCGLIAAHQSKRRIGWQDLTGLLRPLVDTFFPEKEITCSSSISKYLSRDTKAAIARRKRASKAGKNENFMAARDFARRLINRDKLRSISKTLSNAENRQRATWKLADQILGRRKEADLPLLRNCSDDDDCAKVMNEHYIDKTERLRTGSAAKALANGYTSADLLDSDLYPPPPSTPLKLRPVTIEISSALSSCSSAA